MKKGVFFLVILIIYCYRASTQIIADHTVVDRYADIPQYYIDIIKTMWVQVIGESHSGAYRYGVNLLAEQDTNYNAVGQEGAIPDPITSNYLRVSRIWWYNDPLTPDSIDWYRFGGGEEDFWTTQWAINNVKTNITHCNGIGNNPVRAVCFGWCWDMVGASGATDEVYDCRWGGRSYYWNDTAFVDDGNWGLDDDDSILVDPAGNRHNVVSMQTYIDAIEEINNHDQNTLCFFTTGPVDNADDGTGSTDNRNEGESGYQRYIKHEYIRNHVKQNGGILFDFADILSYNNAGKQNIISWNGHDYPLIHPDNDGEYNGGSGSCHLGEEGCIRLAKALWWMLANIAGWGEVTYIHKSKESNIDISCSPNPFKSKLNIAITQPVAENIRIEILNCTGQTIDVIHEGYISKGKHSFNWYTNNSHTDGLYICKISSGTNIYATRIIKIR